MLPSFVDRKEQEAAGIFTQALSIALQATFGGGTQDQKPTNLNQQAHNISDLAQKHTSMNTRIKTKKQAYADFESVDGRFVTPDQLHRRKSKHVPRDIAVTPKRRHRHESMHHAAAASDGSASDKSDDTPELKPSKTTRKGFGKFLHKIGLAR